MIHWKIIWTADSGVNLQVDNLETLDKVSQAIMRDETEGSIGEKKEIEE